MVTDPVMLELYDFEGLSAITNYSDLHYQQTGVNLGGTYHFTPALYLTARAGWQQFVDKTPYVYGDQDGTSYLGQLGVGYNF